VISGALVLVAAVLLVLGIISSITLVYAAIGLSIVSAVFLLVGVFQRPAPGGEPRESESEGPRRQAARSAPADEHAEPDEDDEPEHIDLVNASGAGPARDSLESFDEYDDGDYGSDEYGADEAAADYPLEKTNADFEVRSGATGADVLVISGRPRYHIGGCDYVEGNDDSEPLEINEARELGFTPCGACRPNETLARGAAAKERAPSPRPTPAPAAGPPARTRTREPERVADPEPETTTFEPAPVTVAAAPVARPPDAGQNHKPQRQPVAQAAPAPLAPPPVAEPVPDPVETAPEPAPVAAVAEPEAAAEPVAPTTGRAARPRTVLAVAATKEYHRSDCELLIGAVAQEITRVNAIRQGYLACGVCKP
jgi:hypothetical protein